MSLSRDSQAARDATDKIRRLQRSLHYRSFFSAESIAAFKDVESSALAGKSLLRTKHGASRNKA